MPPSLLIALPHGLGVSGVVLWAARLANSLAARGCGTGLIVHPEPPGSARLDLPLDPRVGIFRVPERLAPLAECRGDLEPYLPTYRAAVSAMAAPVVLSPNLLGDCYGLAAVLTREYGGGGDRLRVVGWQHSDIEYDSRVLAHYEPILAAFVAVSDRLDATLRARLAGRAADIAHIPYGVVVAAQCPTRAPGRALRLLYAGRIEHEQKRILALPALSTELARRGVEHELTIVGDGPASHDLDAALRSTPNARRLPPGPPAAIARLLEEHDAFVLPSRYEGLSVSMLEAMARGCVPIVTRTDSGAMQAIDDGVNGIITDVDPHADEQSAALALADAVCRFATIDGPSIAYAAWRTARDRFSLERHTDRVESLLDAVTAAPARGWPRERPAAFTAPDAAGGSGSVPPDGPRRMAEVLSRLAGRRVVIHGTGQHTLQLRDVILNSPAVIVAFVDDDRARQNTQLWEHPVIAPADARRTGATDVVISSWMHETAIWSRREQYERQGLAVSRIYSFSGGATP